MFVMLSVRTTTSVRERHAETVQKAININQLIRNISNRKHRKPRTTSEEQPQQQQQPETAISSIIRRSKYHGRRRSNSNSSSGCDKERKDLNNAKPNNCQQSIINANSSSSSSSTSNNSSSSSSSSSSNSNNSSLSCDTPEVSNSRPQTPSHQQPRSKTINIERNCNRNIRRVTDKIDKTVQLIGTVVPAVASGEKKGTRQQQEQQEQPAVTLCTISQPNRYQLPSEIHDLSVELTKPQYAISSGSSSNRNSCGEAKVQTELVLAATVRPTVRTPTALKGAATVSPPAPTTGSIAPPEHGSTASNLNVNQQSDATDKDRSKFLLPELNNFRKPPTVQVPVATILNDLSPVPAPVKVTNKITNSNPMSPMTPAGLQSNSPDVKAMRYYRLWIYTCNAVLLMAVIVFCGVAGKILLSDYKRLLVNGLSLTQPSFIYAYLALLVQSGFLQLIGCLGALRLSEKLLNAYWLLLLVLLIGDAMLGIFWMFKFDKVMHDLQPMLRYRLAHEYGNSPELTELWDRLQNEGRCCGVTGPQDFALNANRTYPTSCCTSDITEQISIGRRPLASAIVFRGDDPAAAVAAATELAASTIKDTLLMSRNFSELTDSWSLITAPSSSSSSSSSGGGGGGGSSSSSGNSDSRNGSSVGGGATSSTGGSFDSTLPDQSDSIGASVVGGPSGGSSSSSSDSSSTYSSNFNHPGSGSSLSATTGSAAGSASASGSNFVSGGETEEIKTIVTCRAVYPQGCADRIVSWLRHTADVLFVLGYCVIAFLKLCFLGILRYEIKEMIQKIKLLQTEMSGAILNGVDCDQQQIQQFTLLQQVTSTSVNGGIHAEPKVGNRDRERTRVGSAESERESLLAQENTPKQQQQQLLKQHKQLYTCINEQQQQQPGLTSSLQQQHVCGSGAMASGSGAPSGSGAGGVGGTGGAAACGCESDTNSNCALLVEDTNTTSLLSSATGTTTKTINGNNNYELCEFDAKMPTYRLLNAPTVTRI